MDIASTYITARPRSTARTAEALGGVIVGFNIYPMPSTTTTVAGRRARALTRES